MGLVGWVVDSYICCILEMLFNLQMNIKLVRRETLKRDVEEGGRLGLNVDR